MTKFKDTILGKILKGAAKIVKPLAIVAGSVLGIGAVSGIVKGVGAAAGVGAELKGIGKVASTVSQSAVNLVTGTTKAERDQVKEVQGDAKAAQDKLDQVERLVNAGATRAKAMEMAGVTAAEMGSANSAEIDAENAAKLKTGTSPLTSAGSGGCMVTSIILFAGAGAMLGIIVLNLFT